jgi:hypothetical protein
MKPGRVSGFFAFLLLLLLLFPSSSGGADSVTVEAEGMALIVGGDIPRAKEEAKRQLYRDALEKGIGTYVQGITEMKDFAVVRDEVFSRSEGLVTATENLKEERTPDGMLRLTASCTVSTKTLDGVLGPAVIHALGNPRVLVLIDEVVEGERQFLSTAEAEVSRIFQKAGYLMLLPEQVESIRKGEMDAARISGDTGALQALARSFQSDVLIHGKAQGTSFTKQKIAGVDIYGVRSQLQLKAVITQTARILGTETEEQREKGTSPGDGAIKGFQALAPRMAEKLVHTVAYALASGSAGGVSGRMFKVTIGNLSFGEARSLRGSLESAGGVVGVYQRSYANRTLEMDVAAETSLEEIALVIESLGIEITSFTAGTLEGRKGQ